MATFSVYISKIFFLILVASIIAVPCDAKHTPCSSSDGHTWNPGYCEGTSNKCAFDICPRMSTGTCSGICPTHVVGGCPCIDPEGNCRCGIKAWKCKCKQPSGKKKKSTQLAVYNSAPFEPTPGITALFNLKSGDPHEFVLHLPEEFGGDSLIVDVFDSWFEVEFMRSLEPGILLAQVINGGASTGALTLPNGIEIGPSTAELDTLYEQPAIYDEGSSTFHVHFQLLVHNEEMESMGPIMITLEGDGNLQDMGAVMQLDMLETGLANFPVPQIPTMHSHWFIVLLVVIMIVLGLWWMRTRTLNNKGY